MLIAVPTTWFSSGYKVLDQETAIASVNPSWWSDTTGLTIEGAPYRAYREHWLSGAYILESNGAVLARAVKPRALYRSFEIEYAGKNYTLQAESVLGRTFVLLEGNERLGSVYPAGVLSRKAMINLPEGISLPGRIFIFWLVMIQWAADASAAT